MLAVDSVLAVGKDKSEKRNVDESRRRTLKILSAGLAIAALAGVGAYEALRSSFFNPPITQTLSGSSENPPSSGLSRVVYGYLIDRSGGWNNPESPNVAIPAILNSGAKYVKTGNGAAPNSDLTKYLQQLINAGIQLGVRITPFGVSNEGGGPSSTPRTIDDIKAQAQTLLQSGFYQWVFIDHALYRSDIQDVVNTLAAVGWNQIMTNESAFYVPKRAASPPSGVWAHAKQFDVLSKNPAGTTPITSNDTNYINYIQTNFPGSHIMLKLEVAPETEKFKAMPLDNQKQLLTEWAQGQATYGYRMIYPMFTGTGGAGRGTYDSIVAGTYDLQVSLMKQYG